jgi:hypothetical protein
VIAAVARLATTFALLPSIGVAALGIGWAVGSLSEMPLVLSRIHRAIGARLLRCSLRPAVVAAVATGAGWAVAEQMGVTAASGVSSIAVSLVLFAGLMLTVARDDANAALSILRGAYRSIRARQPA